MFFDTEPGAHRHFMVKRGPISCNLHFSPSSLKAYLRYCTPKGQAVHPSYTLQYPSSKYTKQPEWSIQSWRTLLVYWRVSWFSWSIYYLLINFQYLTECTNIGRYLPQSHLNFATWPSLVGPTVQELETWKTLWHEVTICQNHLHHMEQLFYVVL